jgi:hypothetical protein
VRARERPLPRPSLARVELAHVREQGMRRRIDAGGTERDPISEGVELERRVVHEPLVPPHFSTLCQPRGGPIRRPTLARDPSDLCARLTADQAASRRHSRRRRGLQRVQAREVVKNYFSCFGLHTIGGET